MVKYMLEIIIMIFILLGVSIFLVGKYCKKKLLKISLVSAIILIALYCVILFIDISRINSLKKPIFVVEYAKQDYDDFSKTIYKGLGYRIEIETKKNNQIISTTMYMFEKVIAAAITDSDKESVSIDEDNIRKTIELNMEKILSESDGFNSNPYTYIDNEYYSNIVQLGVEAVPVLIDLYNEVYHDSLMGYIDALAVQDIADCDLKEKYNLSWSNASEFFKLWKDNNCSFNTKL